MSGTNTSAFEDREHTVTCTVDKANPAASFEWWMEMATERISLVNHRARVSYKKGYFR